MLPVPPATVRSWLEPMVLMGALAGVTRTIKLGPMGVTLPFRNPVYYAKEWATLDHMTGGRAIFGIAVGWNDKEYATMGIPRSERGRRMNELVEAIVALFQGENVSYHGKYYKFDNITLEPKPVQGRVPPIWMPGGTQPFEKIYAQTVRDITPVLHRIAKYASVWIPHSPSTPEMVRGDWAKIQEFMKEYGRKPDELTKAYCNFAYVLKKASHRRRPFRNSRRSRRRTWISGAIITSLATPTKSRSHPRACRGVRRLRTHHPQPGRLGYRATRGMAGEVLRRVMKGLNK